MLDIKTRFLIPTLFVAAASAEAKYRGYKPEA